MGLWPILTVLARGSDMTMVSDARARTSFRATTGLLAGLVMLLAGSSQASDHGITGKKLALKPTKFVVVSKDGNAHGAGSPVCPAADSSLILADGVHTHTFTLPCANWSDRGTIFKYRNASAATGPAQIIVAKGGTGRLRVVGRGLGGFPIPNGPATIDAILKIGGTIEHYCMAFTGTGSGTSLLVRNAPAAACPVCGNNTVEVGESCDGSAAPDCPGECQPDCTCPPPVCGNAVREGPEACDGTDATACPGSCQSDCTCPSPCSGAPGDATGCQAFGTMPQCAACCAEDEECLICAQAFDNGCSDPISNDHCSLALTVVGCAAVCCTAP